uniref:Uncharacterized protein n=1 Tax=Astyanax mexicanus TaxID=7994 RepID=A0A3B1KEM0_ASTMX
FFRHSRGCLLLNNNKSPLPSKPLPVLTASEWKKAQKLKDQNQPLLPPGDQAVDQPVEQCSAQPTPLSSIQTLHPHSAPCTSHS